MATHCLCLRIRRIYKLGLQGLAEEDFKRHTEAIIRLELL